ncbi:MAG TPA: glycosyltransferase family 4 protein [Nitrospiraceae bacterium]|nr:glycosyltransferase family 4 protein [Nitrospiraceae bacterium]
MTPIVLAELAGSASYGGGERYLELLFDHLDHARYRGLLICPEPGPFVRRMQERGVETQLVHLAPLFNPFALWRLTRLLVRERVTILQTHGARANFYGRIAGRLARVPVIISTVHNSLKDYEVRSFRRGIYTFMLRLTLPFVHRIICVSDANRWDLIDECPAAKAKTHTVYNGVDLSAFSSQFDRQDVRQEIGVLEGPVLVTIARLTEQKGHRYLIQALPCLLETWPQLCCLFVGEGELRDALHRMAIDLGVERTCRFVGVRQDIADILTAADVCVLPSLSEGFPFVLLEALAIGCPVVASRVNGVPELIEDHKTGLLVPSRDSQALARAIREVLSNPTAASKMGAKGQAMVRERFTVDHMVANTTAIFDAAMEDAGMDAVVQKRAMA